MTKAIKQSGVIFVYDGACPMCKNAAMAFRIRKDFGKLTIIDARTTENTALIADINARQLDLDAGMVIIHGDSYYHGREALIFMAKYSEDRGLFNKLNRALFRYKAVAKAAYPFLRAVRNTLIRLRGKQPIYNLYSKHEPTYTRVYGDDWAELPPVLKAHYQNKPFSDERYFCEGTMSLDVQAST